MSQCEHTYNKTAINNCVHKMLIMFKDLKKNMYILKRFFVLKTNLVCRLLFFLENNITSVLPEWKINKYVFNWYPLKRAECPILIFVKYFLDFLRNTIRRLICVKCVFGSFFFYWGHNTLEIVIWLNWVCGVRQSRYFKYNGNC